MKNDSTSDHVINATATDICDVLENLSAGTHTIKINGEINNETLIAITETIQNLNNPDTLINLDLSNVTCLTSIEDEAFTRCKSLISVITPESVTSIGNWAFSYCGSLTSVTIPNCVTSIGDGAFYSCESLTNITIPDNMTSIGDNAFYNCESLTSVTIPDSVTFIGDGAFCGCQNLTSFNVSAFVRSGV